MQKEDCKNINEIEIAGNEKDNIHFCYLAFFFSLVEGFEEKYFAKSREYLYLWLCLSKRFETCLKLKLVVNHTSNTIMPLYKERC